MKLLRLYKRQAVLGHYEGYFKTFIEIIDLSTVKGLTTFENNLDDEYMIIGKPLSRNIKQAMLKDLGEKVPETREIEDEGYKLAKLLLLQLKLNDLLK